MNRPANSAELATAVNHCLCRIKGGGLKYARHCEAAGRGNPVNFSGGLCTTGLPRRLAAPRNDVVCSDAFRHRRAIQESPPTHPNKNVGAGLPDGPPKISDFLQPAPLGRAGRRGRRPLQNRPGHHTRRHCEAAGRGNPVNFLGVVPLARNKKMDRTTNKKHSLRNAFCL